MTLGLKARQSVSWKLMVNSIYHHGQIFCTISVMEFEVDKKLGTFTCNKVDINTNYFLLHLFFTENDWRFCCKLFMTFFTYKISQEKCLFIHTVMFSSALKLIILYNRSLLKWRTHNRNVRMPLIIDCVRMFTKRIELLSNSTIHNCQTFLA